MLPSLPLLGPVKDFLEKSAKTTGGKVKKKKRGTKAHEAKEEGHYALQVARNNGETLSGEAVMESSSSPSFGCCKGSKKYGSN